ncbi:DUF6162 family protein [Psychromonas sp. SR45-3]|uniref:DUF6162 family protein n=1 Tax=Psychromonas sp. SR45-3 TaxID=2760930 RepID=UPI0015FC8551|nr:hypothetical protein [Psychromonas sp. SR45-3]MBB1273347.1 hypothetical protein [Psychromonas sp. SR45-3]
MNIQAVVSENKGHEGYWIATLCLLILLIGALLLPYNSAHHQHQPLADHQLLITDLPPPPLAMIAELRLAHEEIRYFYQVEQDWLTVTQLEQDWIAPFVKDKSWAHQGEHDWSLVAAGIYQSTPAKGGIRYLLNSRSAQVDIWLQEKPQASATSTFDLTALATSGWIQVVFSESQLAEQHTEH